MIIDQSLAVGRLSWAVGRMSLAVGQFARYLQLFLQWVYLTYRYFDHLCQLSNDLLAQVIHRDAFLSNPVDYPPDNVARAGRKQPISANRWKSESCEWH